MIEKKNLTINYLKCGIEDLLREDQMLVERAMKACERSYSPYSKFRVGAALLLENGAIVEGSNQENVAFPSGTCAERCAIFYANSQYPGEAAKALAIAACNEDGKFTEEPITPCGACRQVMVELKKRYGNKMRILLYGSNGTYVLESIDCLLPFLFDGAEM